MNPLQEPLMSWAEIDLAAIRHNYRTLKKMGQEILPVVKADAYGHGMLEVAGTLDRLGVKFFGVSDVAEGMELRRAGFKKDILLLENTLPQFADLIVDCRLIASVCTLELAAALNRYAAARGQKLRVHIKVDTGMGRLGVWHEEAPEFIRQISRFSHLVIDGIFTHFPLADTNRAFTQKQVALFAKILKSSGHLLRHARYVHAANSMGLAGYHNTIFNLARPGLMLYGLYPTLALKKKIPLKPAMKVVARVIYVKDVSQGRGISYGHTFVARKTTKIATVAIGYSDGYFRALSNKAWVLINGRRCPVVGNVTMDQIMVDVSKVRPVRAGDLAVILGQDKGQCVCAQELGRLAVTINYEVVCNLGNRMVRVFRK